MSVLKDASAVQRCRLEVGSREIGVCVCVCVCVCVRVDSSVIISSMFLGANMHGFRSRISIIQFDKAACFSHFKRMSVSCIVFSSLVVTHFPNLAPGVIQISFRSRSA